MEQSVIVIGAVIGLIIVIWILSKLTKSIKPMSEDEAIQHEVNKRANDDIPSSSGKKSGGCGWLILIILLGLFFAWIWLGKGFHP